MRERIAALVKPEDELRERYCQELGWEMAMSGEEDTDEDDDGSEEDGEDEEEEDDGEVGVHLAPDDLDYYDTEETLTDEQAAEAAADPIYGDEAGLECMQVLPSWNTES